jgi:methionyl-tRNA synthetase
MSDAYEDSWLSALVRETLRRPADDLVADATLTSLGVTSIQAIALQFQIGERTGLEIPLDTLLDEFTVGDLSAVLAEMQVAGDGE